jgi:hypothetical protein
LPDPRRKLSQQADLELSPRGLEASLRWRECHEEVKGVVKAVKCAVDVTSMTHSRQQCLATLLDKTHRRDPRHPRLPRSQGHSGTHTCLASRPGCEQAAKNTAP